MGSFLDKPVTEKETEVEEQEFCGESLAYGVSAMQGWRVTMEDTHIHSIGFDGSHGDLALFGVFDGHGGDKVAKHVEAHFIGELVADERFKRITDHSGPESADALGGALTSTFLRLDRKMEDLAKTDAMDRSGCTAIMAMLTPTHYVIANCGDSRLVIVGDSGVVTFATADHKPSNPEEQARIERAGGTVMHKRINSDLAVSRAFGDFYYKTTESLPAEDQQVSVKPDISVSERRASDQFIILACDGIWDVMQNQEVAKFVMDAAKAGKPLATICEAVIDRCLDLGSRDNMSVIIVALPGAPKISSGSSSASSSPASSPRGASAASAGAAMEDE